MAAFDVVLAGPDYLDRLLHSLCDVHRFADEIRLRVHPPSETAAEKSRVKLDLFGPQPRDGRCPVTTERLELSAGPELATVLAEVPRAVQGLHGRVGQIRHLVIRRLAGSRHRYRYHGRLCAADGFAGQPIATGTRRSASRSGLTLRPRQGMESSRFPSIHRFACQELPA